MNVTPKQVPGLLPSMFPLLPSPSPQQVADCDASANDLTNETWPSLRTACTHPYLKCRNRITIFAPRPVARTFGGLSATMSRALPPRVSWSWRCAAATATMICLLSPRFHCAEGARTVLQIVVDDLGRADLGFRNNQSHTPTLNMMAREGVVLGSHYVFQVSPQTAVAKDLGSSMARQPGFLTPAATLSKYGHFPSDGLAHVALKVALSPLAHPACIRRLRFVPRLAQAS